MADEQKKPETAKPEPVKHEVKALKPQTNEEMQAEILRLELEAKRLEVEERKANLEDKRESLDERQNRREARAMASRTNGSTLREINKQERAAQSRCNHRKGGNGAEGIVGGQGNDTRFAVIKHKMSNGDVWVRCQRCGKTWKPPVKSQYDTKEAYDAAKAEYEVGFNLYTNNTMSGSVVFQVSDGGEYFREVTKDSNLR